MCIVKIVIAIKKKTILLTVYKLYKNYLKPEDTAVDVNKTYFAILYVNGVTFNGVSLFVESIEEY